MISPTLLWFRRDLRLSDHAALIAAVNAGAPVVPVFICDSLVDALGAAPKWRLGEGLRALERALMAKGSRLILRRGAARDVLSDLIEETGASRVYWSRAYDPDSVARDTSLKSELKAKGIEARSFGGHLMFEPGSVETKTGGYYKVFTPFWRNVRTHDVEHPRPAPKHMSAPPSWPRSEVLEDWTLGRAMARGAPIVAEFAQVGEDAALDRLEFFMAAGAGQYPQLRDVPGVDGTSGLSENLALGEISPHQCWHRAQRSIAEGVAGAEAFARQLVWREFAYHLMQHTPHLLTQNWKPGWDKFPWREDGAEQTAMLWKQGRTGIRFVDAAMREMYVTGRMHNRGRMIVASYLTKHLMTHWRVGQKWFEDCLIDWDPACNAMGWQWAAGSGPDAAPYFRVFNPVSQREKFDPQRRYVDQWIAEGMRTPHNHALKYFEAIPRKWGLSPDAAYPAPVVEAAVGRKSALSAYEAWGNQG